VTSELGDLREKQALYLKKHIATQVNLFTSISLCFSLRSEPVFDWLYRGRISVALFLAIARTTAVFRIMYFLF
jgi:hypothetical protein